MTQFSSNRMSSYLPAYTYLSTINVHSFMYYLKIYLHLGMRISSKLGHFERQEKEILDNINGPPYMCGN